MRSKAKLGTQNRNNLPSARSQRLRVVEGREIVRLKAEIPMVKVLEKY